MEGNLIQVSSEKFKSSGINPFHIFNNAEFALLNEHKCDEVLFFLYQDSKYRLGIFGGVRDNIFLSPFSAPFGGFSYFKADVQIKVMEDALCQLERNIKQRNVSRIRISLCPLIYNESFVTKQMNVLYRSHYNILNFDLDFYINLHEDYQSIIWYNARKNIRKAKVAGFSITRCNNNLEEQKLVFEAIKENRISKGKPMNMSFDEIHRMGIMFSADFFLLKKEQETVAGAILYKASPNVYYVPFWGDRPGYTDLRPMNLLVEYLVEFCKGEGADFLHIGIATEDSLPNYGLCDFKESIGSVVTPKLSFEKELICDNR